MYVGKATSLLQRVNSYFNKAHNTRIAELVRRIKKIDYQITDSVLEALVLEANTIKALQPSFNVLLKDDKSFLYLAITNEDFPRPILLRGHELEKEGIKPFAKTLPKKLKKKYKAIYGPYPSGKSLRKALSIIRKAIPWSVCRPVKNTGKKIRPCFDAQIGLCPGVCVGAINRTDYKRIIRNLMRFFEGGKKQVILDFKRRIKKAVDNEDFETAAILKKQMRALEHIQDVALISQDDEFLSYKKLEFLKIFHRIEAYDISNFAGDAAVGSMVVFINGEAAKNLYRRFKIKHVKQIDDFAMLAEVILRRIKRGQLDPKAWPWPDLIVVDGGKGQVSVVKKILSDFNIDIPVIGIAKGADRKKDEFIIDQATNKFRPIIVKNKKLIILARDEAHRFAVSYHRKLRNKQFLGKNN